MRRNKCTISRRACASDHLLRIQLEVVRQIPEFRQFHDEAVKGLPSRQRGVDAGKGVVYRDGARQTGEELTEVRLAMPCVGLVRYLETDLLWHGITHVLR